MKKWHHTKLGNWFWRNWWYRVDWWLGERRFVKWVKYGKECHTFITFKNWRQLHEWEDNMIKIYDNPIRKSVFNIFRPYDKWFKANIDEKA